jgi:hypothetical protein
MGMATSVGERMEERHVEIHAGRQRETWVGCLAQAGGEVSLGL